LTSGTAQTFFSEPWRGDDVPSKENSLHWILDVSFQEDGSRIRKGHASENFAVIRHMALNLLKSENSCKLGIKTKRRKAGWDTDYLAKVLANA